MPQIKNWVVVLFLLANAIFYCPKIVAQSFTQSNDYKHPMEGIFEKGLFALKVGDTNTAFADFESAYTFSNNNEQVSYHYIALSLNLQKPFAENLALQFLKIANSKIYISRIHFLLGKYYFNLQNEAKAITSFTLVNIEDLDNDEIIQMKYQQGYLYFKAGIWDKATDLLNTIRQIKNSPYYAAANYYAGFIALENKDFKNALQYFTIASANKTYARLTPFYISQLYYFLGDVDASMLTCEKALEAKNQYYEIQLKQLMGHLLFEKKQYQKALPYLAEYIKQQNSVDPQDLYQLSFCYFQSQNWTNAIEGFKKLANVEDSLGQNSMYLLATAYLKIDDKMGAKNAFLICATKSQNSTQKEISLFNYGKLAATLKEYSVAITSLDKFMVTYPNSPYFNEAKNIWVTSLALSNNYPQALIAYETIKQPTIDLLKLYPNILFGKATVDINNEHIENAYLLLSKILNTPYNDNVLPQTLFWLGELLYKMNKIDESIIYFERFLSNPVELPEVNQRHARYSLAYGYFKKGIYEKALENFSLVARYNHSNMIETYQKDAFLRIADCQLMQKQYKAAMQSYQKVIEYRWEFTDYATFQLAIINGGIGKLSEKIKILTDFDDQFPQSLYINDALIELADTYTNQEKFKEAVVPLTKILINKNATIYYPLAYYKLGIVYFNLNKNEEALSTFKDLVNKYPKAVESENAIEFIKNIFLENQTPSLYIDFMKEQGRPISNTEQDSLSYQSAIINYDQKKYVETTQGLQNYLIQFPNGIYQLSAKNILAEILYAQKKYDSAVIYFEQIADLAPNKFAEKAALVAGRINYFNFSNFKIAEKYFSILQKIATQKENRIESLKGLLRCAYKQEHWENCASISKLILQENNMAVDDIQMANMALFHQSILIGDTTTAMLLLNKVIKLSTSEYAAEANYLLAKLYVDQGNLILGEKTSFELIKKQTPYEFWITSAYILLGDIYSMQKDNFNAIATYKSVVENASIDSLKTEANNKLKLLVEKLNNK